MPVDFPRPRPTALLYGGLVTLCATSLGAQYGLLPADDFALSVTKDGEVQSLAWTGGLNHPQVYSVDVDGDGLLDYYLFDRAGDVHLAIGPARGGPPDELVDKTAWVREWPAAQHYVVPRDFDGDGAVDLFTSSSESGRESIFVYAGRRGADGRLSFEQVDFGGTFGRVLPYETASGSDQIVYVAKTDIPTIEDVDDDGDLDILAFDPSGSYIHFYRNGADGAGARDRLDFTLASRCYGGIIEDALTSEIRVAGAPGACAAPGVHGGGLADRGGLHPGSTLTLYDLDGDGDRDALIGDVQTGELTALFNSPEGDVTYYGALAVPWPFGAGETPVDLPFFPVAFPVAAPGAPVGSPRDEILVASNQRVGGEDVRNLWRYTTGGEVDYQLQSRSYLTDRAFDHGTESHVAAGQLDGRGAHELIIGNEGEFDLNAAGGSRASLRYYACPTDGDCVEQRPAWLQRINRALAGTDQLPITSYDPVLHDMDGDGDLDLLIGYSEGGIAYAQNVTRPTGDVEFDLVATQWEGINVGLGSSPAVGDVNGDGRPDLIVGEQNGNLNLYLNSGTSEAPAFAATPDEEEYGETVLRLPGFGGARSRPAFVRRGDELVLYVGTADGRLLVFDELPAGVGGTARLAESIVTNAGDRLDPVQAFDAVAEQAILLLGNRRGGVVPFRFEDSVPVPAIPTVTDLRVVPNPTSGAFSVRGLPQATPLEVFDALGRRVARGLPAGAAILPEVLPKGVYTLRTSAGGEDGTPALRVVKQ